MRGTNQKVRGTWTAIARLLRRRDFLSAAFALACTALLLGLLARGTLHRRNSVEPPDQPVVLPPRPTFADAEGTTTEIAALRDECFDVAEGLARTLPDNPYALCLLGTVHNLFGNDTEALHLWRRCLDLDPQFADAHLMLAKWAAGQNDHVTAEQHLLQALRLDPAWDEVPLPLADALLYQNKLRNAVEVLETFVARNPDSAEAWCRLGRAYDQLSDYASARGCYLEALAVDPHSGEAHYGAGTVLNKLGQREQAREHLDKFRQWQSAREAAVRAQQPETVDETRLRQRAATTHLTAARVYVLHKQLDRVEQHWKRAAELDRNDVESRESLCALYAQEGRLEEELVLRRDLCDREPGSPGRWLAAGAASYRSGRLEEAEVALLRAIDLAPRLAEGYALLAQVQAQRDLPAAIHSARTAVDISPTGPNYFILATILGKAGDEQASRQALEQAVRLDPAERSYREAYARLKRKP